MSVINPVISQVIRPVTQPPTKPPKGGGGGKRLTRQLVAAYDFYDADTTSLADSAGSNTLTRGAGTNNPTLNSGANLKKIGQALYYGGASAFKPMRNTNAAPFMPNGGWTMCCWVQWESALGGSFAGRNAICGVWAATGDQRSWAVYAGNSGINPAGSDGVWVEASTDGTAATVSSVGVAVDVVTADKISDPQFAFVCVRFSPSGTLKIRANGGSDATVSFAGINRSSTADWEVGNVDGAQWNGSIDKLQFWKRELTDAEVARVYNAGAGCDSTSIQNNRIWGYTSLSAAESSGDAWQDGDSVYVCANPDESSAVFKYLADLAA